MLDPHSGHLVAVTLLFPLVMRPFVVYGMGLDLSGVLRRGSGPAVGLRGEHVEGDGGGPGLLVGTEGFAGEGLEVLGEAAFGELSEGLPANMRGAVGLPGPDERPAR